MNTCETKTGRAPPEIIFVPPPAGPFISPYIISVVGALVVLGIMLLSGLFPIGRTTARQVLASVLVIGLAGGVAVMLWKNRSYQALRREFLEQHRLDPSDPLVNALAAAWKQPNRLPKLKDVRAASQKAPGDRTRARIVCYGVTDIPEVGEMFFEPEIVTPTGAVARQLFWAALTVALLGLWLLDYLHLWPAGIPRIRHFICGFSYILVTGFIALAIWIWKGMIRPTYFRMAPGVIQVLEYGFSKSKPTIRSYPMVAGTLAIFTRSQKHLVLTLARDDIHDALVLTRAHRSKQIIERAWQALLSTAPTPPLSDEELVG